MREVYICNLDSSKIWPAILFGVCACARGQLRNVKRGADKLFSSLLGCGGDTRRAVYNK